MFYIIYGNHCFDEVVTSYDEACEVVRNYLGAYDPSEVFLEEV